MFRPGGSIRYHQLSISCAEWAAVWWRLSAAKATMKHERGYAQAMLEVIQSCWVILSSLAARTFMYTQVLAWPE